MISLGAPATAKSRSIEILESGRWKPPAVRSTSGRLLACQTLEAAFVLSVALLSLAYEARKLLNWVDVMQRKRRLDETSVVALAPAAKPPHHG